MEGWPDEHFGPGPGFRLSTLPVDMAPTRATWPRKAGIKKCEKRILLSDGSLSAM